MGVPSSEKLFGVRISRCAKEKDSSTCGANSGAREYGLVGYWDWTMTSETETRQRECGVQRAPGSFRDPAGFAFLQNGRLFRQVNASYRHHYDFLISSGLFKALVEAGSLIPHVPVDLSWRQSENACAILEAERVPFVSYPYEWSFGELKAAALHTLAVQRQALEFGMSLKDATGYNIQFVKGRPILIDVLSFEIYEEGTPWVAFRQYCQHFLAPLALMAYTDIRLSQLLRIHIDGIPLDLASLLLPFRSWLSFSILAYIHFHALAQRCLVNRRPKRSAKTVSRNALLGFVESLEAGIQRLKWKASSTEWGDYYDKADYSSAAFRHKKEIVSGFLERVHPGVLWDLGANTGVFSQIAADKGMQTISFDKDPLAVEKNYQECKRQGRTNILPLLLDLTNPSSGTGWANTERLSLLDRGPAQVILCLGLVHHLALSNNVPLSTIARFLSTIGTFFVIEFIPKSDRQVQRLLATREDVFTDYYMEAFERDFSEYFTIHEKVGIADSSRALYLMEVIR